MERRPTKDTEYVLASDYDAASARIRELEAALRPSDAEIEAAADEWPWQEKTKGEGFRAGIAWLQGRVALLPTQDRNVEPSTDTRLTRVQSDD